MSSFYMKGDAFSWFKWMYQNHQLFDWISFTKALELRFGPSTYANHQAELFKLRQSGTVSEYQAQFEKLGNRVIGLPAEALLNCFISGLIPEIWNEMAIQHPTSITQAIRLAKLIEAKIKDSKIRPHKPYNQYPSPNYTKPSTYTTPQTTPTSTSMGLNPTPVSTPTKNNAPPTNKLPIKRLNQAQVQERRALGLYYNCDEKFTSDHKCSASRFLLLLIEEETDTIEDNDEPAQPEETPTTENQPDTYFHLSTQAVTDKFSPQTLRFKGSIRGESVMVLVDTGSTHNKQPK